MTTIQQQKRIANTLILRYLTARRMEELIFKSTISNLPIKITEDAPFAQKREQTMSQSPFNISLPRLNRRTTRVTLIKATYQSCIEYQIETMQQNLVTKESSFTLRLGQVFICFSKPKLVRHFQADSMLTIFAQVTNKPQTSDKSEIKPHQLSSVKKHKQEMIIGHFDGKLFQEMKNKWHEKFKKFSFEVQAVGTAGWFSSTLFEANQLPHKTRGCKLSTRLVRKLLMNQMF
jgi:hypothetical protein